MKNDGSTAGLHLVLNVFQRFIYYFMPTFYIDDVFLLNINKYKEFLSFEYSFAMLHRLLKFHDPEITGFLLEHSITPELYATSWILTLFA